MAHGPATDVQRICVFAQLARTGLGDLVMRNGLFAMLRRGFPGATVTLVIGAEDAADFGEFLQHHCPVDGIIVCPPCASGPPDRSLQWEQLRAELRRHRFDVCLVDAGTLFLHAGLAREVGIGVRVGVRHGHAEEAELTSCADLVARRGGHPDLADYLSAYARSLGLPEVAPAEVVPPLEFEREGPPFAGPRPRITLHVGGGRYWNRRWPLDRYVELCDRLLAERGASLVLVGVQEQDEHAVLLEGIDARLLDRVSELGTVSLARTATVMADSDVFVGSDSGPMHLAVAVGVQTVTLYGPADGVLFWEHVYPRHHPVGRRWPCHVMPHDWPSRERAECEHRCLYPVRPDGSEFPACVVDLTVDEVLAAVYAVLDGAE